MTKASDNVFPRFLISEGGSTATPAASRVTVYAKADGLLYSKDDAGAETLLSGGDATAHIADTSAAHAASAIAFTPNGSIAATDVQAAIQEVRDEAGAGALDLSAMTIERSIQGVSDYVAAYDASAADERGFPVGYLALSRGHTIIRSECLVNAITDILEGGIAAFSSGTGAALGVGTAAVNHPGVLNLSTGTTTTGRTALGNQNTTQVLLAGGKARFLIVAKLTTLSDGTETYSVRLGFQTAFATDGTDAVMFRYSSTLNGGEWQGVTRAASTETTLDTNIAADTNWHSFEAEVNAAGTSVEFFIDGTSVGTIVTNIPTAGISPIPASIIKSAGTTARTLQIDAYLYIFEFTTAR